MHLPLGTDSKLGLHLVRNVNKNSGKSLTGLAFLEDSLNIYHEKKKEYMNLDRGSGREIRSFIH